MENMFEKGCLVQLSVGKWGGVKKIDSSRFANIIDAHEWLTATKKLVDPESLKPICKVGNAARSYLASVSLPFPIQGMVGWPLRSKCPQLYSLMITGFLWELGKAPGTPSGVPGAPESVAKSENRNNGEEKT